MYYVNKLEAHQPQHFIHMTLYLFSLILAQGELTEAEKTEAEIAKLQAAIQEMKTRNTSKKDPGQDMFSRMKSKEIICFMQLHHLIFWFCK